VEVLFLGGDITYGIKEYLHRFYANFEHEFAHGGGGEYSGGIFSILIVISYISVRRINKFILVSRNLAINKYTMKTKKALFKVVGMYCTTCKPIVEKQLRDEEAVKKIDIDYMIDSVIVEFDPSFITKEEIKTRLEK
jgi:copper chaperone